MLVYFHKELLASRLNDFNQLFFFILLSFIYYTAYPTLSHYIYIYSKLLYYVLTSSLLLISIYISYDLFPLMIIITFIFLNIFILFILPFLYILYNIKVNSDGPWSYNTEKEMKEL